MILTLIDLEASIPDVISDFGNWIKTMIVIGFVGLIVVIAGVFLLLQLFGIDILDFKAKKVGDGQHGNARWMTPGEKKKAYPPVAYEPELWRQGQNLPPKELSGVIIAVQKKTVLNDLLNLAKAKIGYGTLTPDLTAFVQCDDKHTGIYAASGAGKTAFFLYPNLEYACACGMSFITTDTKGDLYRNYGYIAKEHYDYNCVILDLRNPTKSHGNNILFPVNKYMDIYKATGDISAKAKSEKYAGLIAESIIAADGKDNYGANTYFYDAAKGLLTSTILLVSEFGAAGERHIPSVFTLITELLETIHTPIPGTNQSKPSLRYTKLIKKLPVEHRARLYATPAVTGSDGTTMSVMTTTLSKLNSFIDSEIEQLLCFENDIDIEKFCAEKTALFIVLPEEDTTKYFMVSLLLQQFYRECLNYADSMGGRLPRRIMFYLDEIGTIPKINGFDMILSAARSRDILLVPIMQSPSQMVDKYGEAQAKTINSNLSCVLYSGFAPESDLAKHVSDALGTVTVLTGTVTTNSQHMLETSTTQQMTGKPLISVNELNQMKKGDFIVRCSGNPPLKSKLMLFKEWGITFPGTYEPHDKGVRPVKYLKADVLERRVRLKYVLPGKKSSDVEVPADGTGSVNLQVATTSHQANFFHPNIPPEDLPQQDPNETEKVDKKESEAPKVRKRQEIHIR